MSPRALLALPLLLLLDCAPKDDPTRDVDGDGYPAATDCDDRAAWIHPAAAELCNNLDDDCDGVADDDTTDGRAFFPDLDGDGWGDDDGRVVRCERPEGMVPDGGDCDDDDASVHPGAPEDACHDRVDYNCDGVIAYTDADRDTWPDCEDCDDADAAIHPDGEEICNGKDDDCDGTADEAGTQGTRPYWADDDGDSYGDPADRRDACSLPVGFVENDDDCDDADPAVYPGAGC